MTKMRAGILIAGIFGVLGVGAVFSLSYLTDGGEMTNDFTTAHVKIQVLEDEWDALPDKDQDGILDTATNIHQNHTVVKDPCVRNDSSIPVYTYLRIRVPVRDVMLVDLAPKRQVTQLFSYDINNTWSLLKSDTSKSDYYEYWYGCSTRLNPNEKTQTLFDSVTYANVVEGEIPKDEILKITVDGYGMQAMGFGSMEEAWEAFDPSQKAMESDPDHSNRKGGE